MVSRISWINGRNLSRISNDQSPNFGIHLFFWNSDFLAQLAEQRGSSDRTDDTLLRASFDPSILEILPYIQLEHTRKKPVPTVCDVEIVKKGVKEVKRFFADMFWGCWQKKSLLPFVWMSATSWCFIVELASLWQLTLHFFRCERVDIIIEILPTVVSMNMYDVLLETLPWWTLKKKTKP